MRLVKLKDCCTIKPPKSEAKKLLNDDELVSFVPMNNLGINTQHLVLDEDKRLSEVSGSYTYFGENDVLLAKITPCFENGKLGIAKGLTNGVGFGSSEFIVFRNNDNLLPEYLYYFLLRPIFREQGQAVMTGAVGHKRIPIDFIEHTEIPLPSIDIQKRLVSILDSAFTGIESALKTAEKNLVNAKVLFKSVLQKKFEKHSTQYDLATWKEALEIRSGKNQKAVQSRDGKYPIIGSAGKVMSYASDYICEEGTTIVGRKGTINNPLYIEQKFWNVDTAFGLHAGERLNKKYLFYFCKSFDFTTRDKGSGRPSLVKGDLQTIEMPIPNKGIQIETVTELDDLNFEIEKITSIYKHKLEVLDELKTSILEKAFSGELTNSKGVAV